MSSVLVDSNFLYALFSLEDKYHKSAFDFINDNRVDFVFPDITLPEVTFLFRRAGGIHAESTFLGGFALLEKEPEPLTLTDINRAKAIMVRYKFDFVDCAIMALAERLNITQILTFDRRDFSIFQPTHCEYLELLP